MKSLIVSLFLLAHPLTAFAVVDGWRMNPYTGKPDYFQSGVDSATITAIALSTTTLSISTSAIAARTTALESSTSTLDTTKVPYTGAVSDLNMGGFGIRTGSGIIALSTNTASFPTGLGAYAGLYYSSMYGGARLTGYDGSSYYPLMLGPYVGGKFGLTLGIDGIGTFGYAVKTSSDAVVAGITFSDGTRQTTAAGSGGGDVYTNRYNEFTSSNSFSSILISSGTHGAGDSLIASGPGTRFFFYPKKSAIRGGQVTGTVWNEASIGNHSVGFGYDCLASGQYTSCSGGSNSSTYNGASTLGGTGNQATAQSSIVAGGDGSSATGSRSAVLGGYLNNATGSHATVAGGSANAASGDYAVTLGGNNVTSSGVASGAGGQWAQNAADYSFVWGNYVGLSAAADGSMLFGYDTTSVKTYTESGKFYIHGLDLRVSSSTTAAVQYGLTKEGDVTAADITADSFTGSGAGLTSVPDGALSANVALKNVDNNFSQTQTVQYGVAASTAATSSTTTLASTDGTGVSIGNTTAPTMITDIWGDSSRFGLPDGTSGTKGFVRLRAKGGYATIGMDFGMQASGGQNGWIQARDIGTGPAELKLNPIGGAIDIGNATSTTTISGIIDIGIVAVSSVCVTSTVSAIICTADCASPTNYGYAISGGYASNGASAPYRFQRVSATRWEIVWPVAASAYSVTVYAYCTRIK